MNKIELLAPAGDLEKLKVAIMYGADAVYIGGKKFSLRARASNFDISDIEEAVSFAKVHGAKIYVTVNIIPHNENLSGLLEYIKELVNAGVSAVICADFYFVSTIKEHFPNLEVHISTQQSILNHYAISMFANLGASRVVLGRELLMSDIALISKNTDTELEVFVHGGMCMSYSGRCVLSNYMTNRDANRGGCAHSCRWNYTLMDSARKTIGKDNVPFSLGSKDLCGIKHVPNLIKMGISSLKIEGRMKSLHYIATVVGSYRRAIDDYYRTGNLEVSSEVITELKNAENRLVAEGYLGGFPGVFEQLYNMRSEQPTQSFIGIVRGYDFDNSMIIIEQRNYFEVGDNIEVLLPNGIKEKFVIEYMCDEFGEPLEVARHPKQLIKISFKEISDFSMLRKI